MSLFKPTTFLENGFPIEGLHSVALMEGNSKRPIYQIHKWWARRLGSVFRALLISSFLGSHESKKEFWDKYYNGFSLQDKVIYDPFIGGGTTIVEGLRLGCKVIGCDINPVAWFVTKKEVEQFDEAEADHYFKQLEETVGRKIQSFYKTKCSNGHDADVVYALWIRRLRCRKCKKEYDLFNNLIVRETKSNRVIICPSCHKIFSTKSKKNIVRCNKCHHAINLISKLIKKGIFQCPTCDIKERITHSIKLKSSPLNARLFCIEYDCPSCGRGYKSATKYDLELFERTRREFVKNKYNLEFPRQKIPSRGRFDKRPVSHGFRYFYELFNERQLLSLSLLLKEIKKIPDKNIREFFLLTFSSTLETNNVLCKYETNWGKISALFGIPGYHIPERFGENNLWGKGRGTFVRSYLKLKRGKKFAVTPFERIYDRETNGNKREKRMLVNERITTDVDVDYFDFVSSDKRALILCNDSRLSKFIPAKSVDAIITDPPYFDTIMYSELADFFYVWLRLGLKDRYKWFEPETSQRKEEIVVNEKAGKDTQDFVKSFTQILKELSRVLRDDGVLVFTFHHTQKWAWSGLRNALTNAGFRVTATPIIRSEGRTGFRKGNSASYDVCVVCRKSEKYQHVNHERSLHLRNYLQEIKPLKTIGDPLRVSDIFTVVMSKYLSVGDSTAEKIMKDSSLLVAKIQRKTGIKNSS